MINRLTALTFVFVAAVPLLSQTAIVAVRSTAELAVASDSYERTFPGTKPNVVCKVSSVGNIYFAAARVVTTQSGFNVFGLARKAVSPGATIAEVTDNFEKLVMEHLPGAVSKFKTEQPSYYETHIKNNFILETIFFGNENGSPVLTERRFKVNDHGAQNPDVEPVRTDTSATPGNWHISYLGHHDAIVKFLEDNANKATLKDLTPDQAAHLLVHAAIVDDSSKPESEREVGFPINVILLDGKTATWFDQTSRAESRASGLPEVHCPEPLP